MTTESQPQERPSAAWTVPILMYHQVSASPQAAFRKYTVTPRELDRQLRALTLAGFRSTPLEDLAAADTRAYALRRRAVVLTFDDGLRESVLEAVPLLERHGFTATFFLPTGFIGESSVWLRREIGADFPLIGWDEARSLESHGFRCGAHSVTHPRLAQLPSESMLEELTAARRMLEGQLGRKVTELAYPYGSYDAAVRDAAETAGYRLALTTVDARATHVDHPLELPRIPVVGGESTADFLARVVAGRSLRQLVRRLVRGR